MNFKFLLATIFVFTSGNAWAQKYPEIDTIWIYRDTLTRGYTTAGAYTHFDDLVRRNISPDIADIQIRKQFQEVLDRAQVQRHWQTKEGIHHLFLEVKFLKDTGTHRVLISEAHTTYTILGRAKNASASVVDLTAMKRYVVTDKHDLIWLSEFMK